MCRCAIPLLVAVFLGTQVGAAPVPPQPKPDDSVSPAAVKLLRHRKVQKELKMTAEQRVVIFDGLADIEEAYEKKLDELSNMPAAPEQAYEQLDKDRQKSVENLLADSATKGLTAAQRGRLRQIAWHLQGPGAFTDPQVEKKLQLTDAQKKKAADVVEQLKGDVDRYLENVGGQEDDKLRVELFSSRKGRVKEMVDALTGDQKTAWTDLLGDAPTGFAIDELWLKIEMDADQPPPLIK